MRRTRPSRPRAFTLVEFLVVIGIIALVAGLLLPILGGIAARGRDLQCQSNIRQCVALVIAYASENKGQLPYGEYFARRGPTYDGWGPSPEFWDPVPNVHVFSVISNMTSTAYPLEDKALQARGPGILTPMNERPPFLRCPEASLTRVHLCSYVGSMAAFIVPHEDVWMGASAAAAVPWRRLLETPTKTRQLLPFSALFWETHATEGMDLGIGYIIGLGVDKIAAGAVVPQFRYYSSYDPLARIPPGTYGNNRPLRFWPEWANDDPRGDDEAGLAYGGTPRFRHNKNTTCNVGYADGHVGKWTGKFKKDGKYITSDALRKHFLVKWPSGGGIAPDPSVPH